MQQRFLFLQCTFEFSISTCPGTWFSSCCLLVHLNSSDYVPVSCIPLVLYHCTTRHPKTKLGTSFHLCGGDNCLGYSCTDMVFFHCESHTPTHTPTLANTASLKTLTGEELIRDFICPGLVKTILFWQVWNWFWWRLCLCLHPCGMVLMLKSQTYRPHSKLKWFTFNVVMNLNEWYVVSKCLAPVAALHWHQCNKAP